MKKKPDESKEYDEIELEYLLSLEVARAVLAHYKKKRTKVPFEEWLDKEITKLQ